MQQKRNGRSGRKRAAMILLWHYRKATILSSVKAVGACPVEKTAHFHRKSDSEGCTDIILDEATASVDPENEHLIQAAISELTKEKP